MINYLTVTARDGKRTLTILNTTASDIEAQIERAKTVRNIGPNFDSFERVQVEVVKSTPSDTFGLSVEAEIAQATARREAWTLYDEAGEVIGSSNGDWSGWHVKSKLVDNLALARFILVELDRARGNGRISVAN